MIRELLIDMTHNNALITNAMLASYANDQNITYIKMIEPFIIYSFPKRLGAKIDISKIAKSVYTNFGLNIKSKVVERILLNLAKDDAGTKVKYEKNKSAFIFYVNEKISTTEFDNKRNYMKSLVVEVVERLKKFINDEENIFKKINSDDAEQILLDFLNNYNAYVYSDINEIEIIQLKENVTSNNYKVAKFIISEYNNELGCFDKIRQIQEGFFASIALYNFFQDIDNNLKQNNTLKNTSIILDTMLLVDALKLDTEYKANSMEELLLLIKENGGVLYTFDYYLDELCRIIEKYVIDSGSRISLDLDSFRRNNINVVQIELLLKSLKDNAEQHSKIILPQSDLEINILSSISYDELIAEKNWHIDIVKLEETVRQNINYSSDYAFNNDCGTIVQILYEKEYNKKNYIFLSSNSNLIFAARDFCNKENKKLFYTDIDLASMIWLSNYDSKSKLSELTLLQNAYAALTPTKEILEEVLNIIEHNMNAPDEQLRNDALLLRYDSDLLYHISSVVKNDKNNVNQNMQNELKKSMKRQIEIEKEQEINDRYAKEYKEKNKELNSKEYLIKQKEEKLKKREQILLERENKIDKSDIERETAKKNYQLKNQQLDYIRELTKKRFDIISTILSFTFSGLFYLLVSTLIFITVYYLAIFCFVNIIKNDYINNIYQLSTLISFIAFFISLAISIYKFIKKTYKKTKEFIYQFLCRKSKILNHNN